jgi:ubiquinone/menaquinone biosynthesis C-methylase UbiE
MKDNFSKQAALYAKYRPEYPQEMYAHILSRCTGRSQAWDCATGNGQVAKVLAEQFGKVYATDISEKQLANAVQADNLDYSLAEAERTPFPDNHFDLVTVGQALHWFDFDGFFNEVKRVLKPGGVLAVWGYSNMLINESLDKLNFDFYHHVTGPYWDEERKYIDDRYESIAFPFEDVQTHAFEIVKQWDVLTLEGFLNTWSAVQHFIRQEGYHPVPAFIERLQRTWAEEEERVIRFPIFLKTMQVSR